MAVSEDIPLRNEGQRQLLARPETHAQIAAELGCTKQVVSYWRRGSKRPGKEKREALEALFGIPVAAWSQKPASAPAPAEVDLPELTPLEHVEQLLAEARRRRATGSLIDSEYNKALALESRLLDQKERLRREEARARAEREILEARVVAENPAWQRVRKLLGWVAGELEQVQPALADELERRLAEAVEA